jgi:hypothetical protein
MKFIIPALIGYAFFTLAVWNAPIVQAGHKFYFEATGLYLAGWAEQ